MPKKLTTPKKAAFPPILYVKREESESVPYFMADPDPAAIIEKEDGTIELATYELRVVRIANLALDIRDKGEK